MRSLVKSRWLVRSKIVGGAPEAIANGALVIEDGRVLEVGIFDELSQVFPDAVIEGRETDLVMPGFVNAHHHVGLTPLQLGAPDLPLELWWIRRLAARAVDLRLDTLYSAFEMIESGITTVQHLHGRVGGPVSNMLRQAQTIIDAYRVIGMRVSYSLSARDQNHLIYQADDRFLASLPETLACKVRSVLATQQATMDEHESFVVELTNAHQRDNSVAIQLAPANLHWCSDSMLRRLRIMSERLDLPLHMHVDETRYQREYARRRTAESAVAHLEKLGLLTEQMTLGHGVWFTEDDIERVARAGAHICCNCSSNLRLRSGIAPLNAFAKAGISMGVGIDEAGVNDDRDMFQELRMLLRVNRVPGMDESDVPSPSAVFRMATEGGAKTTPFAQRIGALQPGLEADLVFVDWNALAYPYLDASVDPIDALVQRGRPEHVRMVMVGGQQIYRDGLFLNIDRTRVLADISEALQRPLTDIERSRFAVAKELMPYARAFYTNYLRAEPSQPFYVLNSRSF